MTQHEEQSWDLGPPPRPMGLKVLYTFDQSGQQCLARWPQILQIPTVPLDEQHSIGVIDLRTCLQAVAQGSPEIVNQQDVDYTVYASDYSEPDIPLVGQGMLSWGLDSRIDPHSQQRITGRVTKNLLALFGNGSRETLEVRLKLTATGRMHRCHSRQNSVDSPNLNRLAPTPTSIPTESANSEWNSFVQSNPGLGRGPHVATLNSPNPAPAQLQGPSMPTVDNARTQYSGYPPSSRPGSIPPAPVLPESRPLTASNGLESFHPAHADTAVDPSRSVQPQTPILSQTAPVAQEETEIPPPISRPTSSASTRKTQKTGRPRGRPRKNFPQSETGNTSAAEGTDGDDGPQRKRARLTRAELVPLAPFGSGPDSLRVTASTSGSLRTMRPVGSGIDGPIGNHIQDVPRAPTPVPYVEPRVISQPEPRPKAKAAPKPRRRRAPARSKKMETMSEADIPQTELPMSNQPGVELSQSQGPPSPTEPPAQSPDQGYAPDQDSPADLGSSPPVPRTSAYIRSSPAPSSPILPTLRAPLKHVDSGFMSGGMDDYDEEDMAARGLPGPMTEQAEPSLPQMPSVQVPAAHQNSHAQRPLPQPCGPAEWREEMPGPKELLPVVSIYNPPNPIPPMPRTRQGSNASQSRPQANARQSSTGPDPRSTLDPIPQSTPVRPPARKPLPGSAPAPAAESAAPTKPAPRKRASRSLKRANTAPNPPRSEPILPPVQEQVTGLRDPEAACYATMSDSPELPIQAPESQPFPAPAERGQIQRSASVSYPHSSSQPVPAATTEPALASQEHIMSIQDEVTAPIAAATLAPERAPEPVPEIALERTSEPAPEPASATNSDRSAAEPAEPSSESVLAQPATIESELAMIESGLAIARPEVSKPEVASSRLDVTESGHQTALTQVQPEQSAPLRPALSSGLSLPAPPPPTEDVETPLPKQPMSRPSSRAREGLSLPPPVPASDPVIDCGLSFPLPPPPMSEPPAPACPPSDTDALDSELREKNKNEFRKQTISARIEESLKKGVMPQFCGNCGAIETPTWRKIYCQDLLGVPSFYEFSDKPGFVTTVVVLERDERGQITKHRLVKKNLGEWEKSSHWEECQLCNPCGIWLSKYKTHRPSERWDKDQARLNQPRRKRESKAPPGPRPKRPRTKSNGQMLPTSEAYFFTDPIGPGDQQPLPHELHELSLADEDQLMRLREAITCGDSGEQETQNSQAKASLPGSPKRSGPGSTHSRASGTAASPIAILDDELGATRRLLFPSPRKEGVPKVLGELDVNVVQFAVAQHVEDEHSTKPTDKENFDEVDLLPQRAKTPAPDDDDNDDDLELELFGTPPARPSTPPPQSANDPGPFKTPTRKTPHRVITRSISRSVHSMLKSPGQALLQLQRTPTKKPTRTPRSGAVLASASKRRPHLHAHFALDMDESGIARLVPAVPAIAESPFTAGLNKLLSEANDFTAGSPSRHLADIGLADIDISSLPNIDGDSILQQHLAAGGTIDFGNLLSDMHMPMPSSPPLQQGHNATDKSTYDFGDSLGDDLWSNLALLRSSDKVEGIEEATDA